MPSLEAFIGTVDLSDQEYGDLKSPSFTRVAQEVGTMILPSEKRGKGIGSLAKLAVMLYAFETDGTHTFTAETSECNSAAHRSLTKVGFAHTDTYQRYRFPGCEQTQYWMLANTEAQEALSRYEHFTEDQQRAVRAGWTQYMKASEGLKIVVADYQPHPLV